MKKEFDIECTSENKQIKRIYKQLNKIHNKYPYTMLIYARKVVAI